MFDKRILERLDEIMEFDNILIPHPYYLNRDKFCRHDKDSSVITDFIIRSYYQPDTKVWFGKDAEGIALITWALYDETRRIRPDEPYDDFRNVYKLFEAGLTKYLNTVCENDTGIEKYAAKLKEVSGFGKIFGPLEASEPYADNVTKAVTNLIHNKAKASYGLFLHTSLIGYFTDYLAFFYTQREMNGFDTSRENGLLIRKQYYNRKHKKYTLS